MAQLKYYNRFIVLNPANLVQPPLKVLITRPLAEADELVALLAEHGITAKAQPLFDMLPQNNSRLLQTLMNPPTSQAQLPIVICVSAAAVRYANASYPIAQWRVKQFIAVGDKTRSVLQACSPTSQILTPSQQHSEGVLALAELQQVKQQDIIIVRGDNGRELLADSLQLRGANVQYVASYTRKWRTFDQQNLAKQWQKAQFNCIVATSNGLLERMVTLLAPQSAYWLTHCLWLVASERIAIRAHALGIQQIINLASANNQAICNLIVEYGKTQ